MPSTSQEHAISEAGRLVQLAAMGPLAAMGVVLSRVAIL
jgi:hypothetical protein